MKKTVFVLVYTIAALSIFSFGKASENEQLAFLLNGQYAEKMTDASKKMEELDTAVKKTLLFNEQDGSSKAREDIWRLSSDVKNSVGALPLDRGFSSAWMNYLGRLGNFAKESERTGDNEEYHRVMAEASKNLGVMANEWEVATTGLIDGKMSVKTWANQLDSVDAKHDWKGMGTAVKQYTESDFPLTASESDSMKKKELRDMNDHEITREEAIKTFKQLFPEISNSSIVVETSKPGSPYPFYHLRFAEGQSIGYIDLTEKGGHVLSFLTERPFGKESLRHDEIRERAESFLKDAGYGDTVFQEARENHTAWHFVYVRKESHYGAKVLSDTIHLKVAKDNGGIIGLDAMEYIRKEATEPQKITKKDWSSFFHKGVTVVEEELVYVENDRLDQRLAHYLLVKIEEEGLEAETYVVVVDTETSEVIKTEKQQ
ncbi:PepSY1/2 domain-containing protein [Sporosarcina sp. G11-34]|uniref:PepSY1/2 domain-containing protein n=1 Tax=Sporosarcina sp. G11-34 TaxID=2849605 RepID=UPI0022A96628|nr:PepSY1/2 domain-containing protein [Sporosarcina sp. G11-34]MCZ2259478.1 germination protein YpeB [Sporosarcina sp. G11-34]